MAYLVETPYGPVAAVADWLRANDIDPNDVPIEGPITIETEASVRGWSIRYVAHLRNEQGRKYVDETTGEVAQEQRTAPLKVAPPENVQVTGLN